MADTPGTHEHDIAAGLVAGEAVGGINDRTGAARVDEEAEGIVLIGYGGGIDGALGDQVGDQRPADLGIGRRASHGEHHEHADTARLGGGEQPTAGRRVEQVEPDHRHVEPVVAGVQRGAERLILRRIAVSVNHEAESAIRGWARTNPVVAEFQRRVDRVREEVLTQAFLDIGIDKTEARVLARIGLTILVGTQQIEEQVDRKRLDALLSEYQRWLEVRRLGEV